MLDEVNIYINMIQPDLEISLYETAALHPYLLYAVIRILGNIPAPIIGHLAIMIESQTFSISSTSNQPPSHKADTLRSWERVNSLTQDEHLNLDGQSLDIASLIAVAR